MLTRAPRRSLASLPRRGRNGHGSGARRQGAKETTLVHCSKHSRTSHPAQGSKLVSELSLVSVSLSLFALSEFPRARLLHPRHLLLGEVGVPNVHDQHHAPLVRLVPHFVFERVVQDQAPAQMSAMRERVEESEPSGEPRGSQAGCSGVGADCEAPALLPGSRLVSYTYAASLRSDEAQLDPQPVVGGAAGWQDVRARLEHREKGVARLSADRIDDLRRERRLQTLRHTYTAHPTGHLRDQRLKQRRSQ